MIHRKDKKGMGFGITLNGISKTLSVRAIGLYTVLLQHPDNFEFRQGEVIKRCFPNDGSGIIKTAWKELKKNGILVAKYKTVNKATIQYWDLVELPDSIEFDNSIFNKSNDMSKNDKSKNDKSNIDKSKNDKSNIDKYNKTDNLNNTEVLNNTDSETIPISLPENEFSSGVSEKFEKLKKGAEVFDNHGLPDNAEVIELNPNHIVDPNAKVSKSVGLEIENLFNQFWNAYDKKIGSKSKALAKFKKLKAIEQQKAIDFIPAYKAYQPEKKYRKNPESYLNQKFWESEDILNAYTPNHKHGEYLELFRTEYLNWDKAKMETTEADKTENTSLLNSIITTLVSNAIKHATGESPKVEIEFAQDTEQYYNIALQIFQTIMQKWQMSGFKQQAKIMGVNTELGLIKKNIHQIIIFFQEETKSNAYQYGKAKTYETVSADDY